MINTNIQNDFTISTRQYYIDLKKCQPIKNREEERELLRLAKKGNVSARNKILNAHLKFVFDVAKKYKGKGVCIGDLISEGNAGLFLAIDKFDLSKDIKFITYAVFWIRERMMSAIERFNKKTYLEQSLDDMMSQAKNTSKRFGVNFSENDEIVHPYDNLFPEQSEEKQDTSLKVDDYINTLNPKEKYVITSFYGLGCKPKSLKSISHEMNVSAERVRQIKLSGIRKMRTYALLNETSEVFC